MAPRRRILITGANGQVGRRLTAALTSREETVRCLVRSPEAQATLTDLGAEVRLVDWTQTDSLRQAAADCQIIFHLAGSLDETHWSGYQEANFQTTIHLLRAVPAAEVERFFLLSYPLASSHAEHPFPRSKGLAEDALRLSRLPYTILRSTFIYGPESPLFQWLLNRGARGQFPLIGSGRWSLQPTWVGDVVASLVAALDRPQTQGRVFEIGGPEVVSQAQLLERWAALLNVPYRPRPVPLWRIRAGGWWPPRRGVQPPPTWPLLKLLFSPCEVDNQEAQQALGVPFTPLSEGLAHCLDWEARVGHEEPQSPRPGVAAAGGRSRQGPGSTAAGGKTGRAAGNGRAGRR